MKQCLIVVDMQRDFVTGALGFTGAAAIEDAIAEKIEQYRNNGGEVVFTLDTHEDDYMQTQEGRHLPIPHCLRGSQGAALTPRLAPYCLSDTPVFEKGTFGSMALADFLRTHRYERIELCGVVSHMCVLSNAVLAKAAQSEAEICIDAQCVASPDAALHEKALDIMEGLHMHIQHR